MQGATIKDRQDAEKEVQSMTVEITGARPDEFLFGMRNVTRDAMIKIKNIIGPYKKTLDNIRIFSDLWIQFLDKLASIEFFTPLTREQRAQWLLENQTTGEVDISEVLNSQIEIMNIGNSDFGVKLTQEQLDELLSDVNRTWSTMEVREMFPRKPGSRAKRHTLFFLRQFWKIHVSYQQVNSFAGFSIDISNGTIHQNAIGNIIVLDVGGSLPGKKTVPRVAVPLGFIVPSNTVKYAEKDVFNLIIELQPERTLEDIEKVKYACRNFTAGTFKSLFQKVIRFRAKEVSLGEVLYPSEFVLLVTCGLLVLNPGSFVPDIQRYVSGPESFCKRLVVSIFEDGFAEPSDYPQITSLLSCGLLIQRVKGWFPPLEFFRSWFQLAIKSLNDTRIFNYNCHAELAPFSINSVSNLLQLASVLMDELKSFKSDLNMFRSIAQNNGSESNIVNTDFPAIMPIEHCMDQHCAPDIVYYYESNIVEFFVVKTRDTFSQLFVNIFRRVTGVNSRKAKINNEDPFVVATRKAQKLILIARQIDPQPLGIEDRSPYEFSFTINKEWFAGSVGPITINMRPTAIVTMRPDDLTQLVAVRMPSRDMKDAQLTDQQQHLAISMAEQILKNGVRLTKVSPPISILSEVTLHRIQDEEGIINYYIMHNNKAYSLEDFTKFKIPIPINHKVEITLENALTWNGSGMIASSAEELQKLVSYTPVTILKRVLNYISGYHHQIEFNEISRDGGGTQQAVTFEDIDSFQFLMKVSLIYPLALRKKARNFIKFDVPLPPLLWVIRDFIASVVNKNIVYENSIWGNICDIRQRIPWQHQTDSYNEMVAKNQVGKRGNFLWISVGMGKTLIVLKYLQYLKEINKLPPYVIYTLPDSAMIAIQGEIQAFGFRVENLNPTQTIRTPQLEQLTKRGCVPTPYTVTMIEHDHLRLCKDVLTEVMPYAILIVDEVHKTLNDTLRTSAALELSHLSQDFVCLTGTPVIDTKIYKLTNWISQITNFEVNTDNFWVAVNNLISKKVNTGIIVIREEIEAKFTLDEEKSYHSLVSPELGGKNTSGSIINFNEAITICYKVSNREMISQVILELQQDHGVMLVARNHEHQEQLYQLLLQKGLNSNDIFMIRRGQSIYLTDENVSQGLVPNYKVAITPINYSTGYTLTRFHVMISSVYTSNLASRDQLEGRINRIGQHNKTVTYKYIHIGILTNIMRNHKDAWNLNEVLRTLAKEINI